MNRRHFIAACAGLSLSAAAKDALPESGPLTRIIFPFAAGGGGDTLCRLLAQQVGQLLDRTVIVENHRRRWTDRNQSRQERQARRSHNSGDHRPYDVPVADG